jgi:hypothetical protein
MGDWFAEGSHARPLDVVACLDSAAGAALHALVGAGALVSIGLTSDGGAVGVTVTVDGRWRREYFREAEPLEEWATGALDAVTAAVETSRDARASSGSRRRTRGL